MKTWQIIMVSFSMLFSVSASLALLGHMPTSRINQRRSQAAELVRDNSTNTYVNLCNGNGFWAKDGYTYMCTLNGRDFDCKEVKQDSTDL